VLQPRQNLRRNLCIAASIALLGEAAIAADRGGVQAEGAAAAPPLLASESSAPAGPQGWSNPLFGPQRSGIPASRPPVTRAVRARSVAEIEAAIDAAQPGTEIEIQPGTYDFSGVKIEVKRPGRRDLPIVVRSPAIGSVRLNFSLLEGFHVLAPYWVFENLVITGTCEADSRCEHAFHVVGDAVGVVIQNNWVANFNAAIKVNGIGGHFPDEGIIRYNAFLNDHPRKTDGPASTLDIVSASRWIVQRNLISDFGKAGGDFTSYGAFFKGAGEDNLFEQNLVLCEWQHHGQQRVGFSFGDGGTGQQFCRDGSCRFEHRGGVVRNNIIMNCPNGPGIHLNKSAETLVHNNALIATSGIEVQRPATGATIVNNIVDGSILIVDGAAVTTASNVMDQVGAEGSGTASRAIYLNPQGGDLRLKDREALAGHGLPIEGEIFDLCGRPYRAGVPDIGPIQYGGNDSCVPSLR
jgi:hypothetical protein